MNIFKYINNKIDDYYRRKITITYINDEEIEFTCEVNCMSTSRFYRLCNEYLSKNHTSC